MRKSNIGRGSTQQHGVLKPRNGDFTPSRLSAGLSARRSYIHKTGQSDSAKRAGRVMRRSTDSTGRSALFTSRITPTRQNVPVFVPTSANRMSTDSCRRAGIAMSARKDLRPMSDPSYKTQCISKILEFLSHNGYPHPIQRRTLNTPTTKDFTNIFIFIIQQLDPVHVLPPRYEEEIPKLLKLLLYPVQMTKSSFVTVGSPHTWPAVLAMLVYLVDMAHVYSILSQDSLSSPCYPEDGMYGRHQVFISLYKCNDDDEINASLKEYGEKLMAEHVVTEKGMMEFQREVEAAEEELESLPETSQELQEIQQCYSQYSDDLKKLHSYCQELQVVVQNKTAQVISAEQRLEEVDAEKILACEEVTDLEKLQAQQSLSSADLIHFKNHSKEVGRKIEQHNHLANDLQSQVWNKEEEISRAERNLGSLFGLFQDLINQLKMDDISDKITNCKDLNLRYDDVMIKITTDKKAVKKGTSQAEVKKWEMDQEIGTVKEVMQIKVTERKKLETNIRHNEEEYKFAQEETAQEVHLRLEEIESLHQQILEARKTHKPFYQVQRTEEDKTRELENYKKKKEASLRDGQGFLMKIFQLALESVKVRESLIADYVNHINVECDKFQELLDNVVKF